MSRTLAIIGVALALGCFVFIAGAEAAAAPDGGEVRIETTPDGIRFGTWGGPAAGRRPTLVILANSIEGTLGDPYYRQAGRTLGDPQAAEPFLCVTIDLPCHGQERRDGEPAELDGWRWRLERGSDPVADTVRRMRAVLDHLVAAGRADPNRIAVIGTSRGGFMALHVAAADPRVACAVAYAPVVDPAALREFKGAEALPATRAAALREQAARLAGRPVWISIGANDERVGVDKTLEFATAVHAAAVSRRAPDRCTLHVDAETEGHRVPQGAAEQSAAWILRMLAGPPAN